MTVRYAVLRADKEKLEERLRIRGDIESLERSLFLLNKLENTRSNHRFMYDTTCKQTTEIVAHILDNPEFDVNPAGDGRGRGSGSVGKA